MKKEKYTPPKGTLRNFIFNPTHEVHMDSQSGEFTYTEHDFPTRETTNIRISNRLGMHPWDVQVDNEKQDGEKGKR